MKNRFRTVVPCLLLTAVFSLVACGEASDEVTNTIDCASVCNRYADCYDADFDVSDCTDRCEDEADASESREERLQACNDCIDDKSCSEATFTCGSQCVGIVP